MIIRVDGNSNLGLHELHDFKRLHAEAAAGMSRAQIDAALATMATVDGDSYWVNIEKLRMLGPSADAEWVRNFDAMIASVRKFGWLSNDGASVRCHLKST